MKTATRPALPGTDAPDRPPRRVLRRGLQVVGGVLALALAIVAGLYHHQIWAYATHWRGPPETLWDAGALPGDPLLRIAAVGDVGDGGDDIYVTGAAMYEAGRTRAYDVLYLLGDNVYPMGDPDHLDRRVFRPLRSVIDEGGTELRAILGNHDVMLGRGDEQMQRLGMPGRWHAIERAGVLLVGIDTTRPDDPDQLAWLDRTLAASDATWKIAAMHHPPYSAGYQGSSKWLRDSVVPILERHGVRLVLSGHDHDYQRSHPIDGITYVVSGAGASARRTGIGDFTALATAVNHYVEIAAYPDRLHLRAVEHYGQVFDEVEIGLDGIVTDLAPARG